MYSTFFFFFLSAGSEHEKLSEKKKKIKHCISVSNQIDVMKQIVPSGNKYRNTRIK